jgi:Ca-activated chloride channel family protein
MTRVLHPILVHLTHPEALALLGLLPVFWVVAVVAHFRRRRHLSRLGSRAALRALTSVGRWRRWGRGLCLNLGLAGLIVACAGPRWGLEPQPALALGRDLVVVLDVSRSMLAEDQFPSRLAWARQAVRELARKVQQQGGHRLGLVAFAGQARMLCPLTPDYDHFREALGRLNPADAALAPKPGDEGPASGTRIGLGLRQAVQLHDPRFRDYQDILLLSDGDHPAADDEWRRGIVAARAQGIAVSVIGVGSPLTGSAIPDADVKPLYHGGRKVQTQFQEQPLREIARLTGGVYRPAWNDPRAVADWFRDWSRRRPGRETGDDLLPTQAPRFAWFFGAAFCLLALGTLISDRPRPRQSVPEKKESEGAANRPRRLWWLVPAALVLAGAAPLLDAERWLRAGNAAFEREAYAEAVDCFARAEEATTDPGLVAYNTAAALYRLSRFREAELHYVRSLEDAVGERRTRLLYDLGNCLVQESHGQDAALLDRAIRCYGDCLKQEGIGPELAADTRNNLQIAQALRLRAKARKKDSGPESDPRRSATDNPNGPNQSAGPGAEEGVEAPDPRGTLRRSADGEPAKEGDGQGGHQPTPGAGNLPPVPDSDELVPMSPEDAARHLGLATTRILEERKKQQQARPRPARNVLDW